MVAALPKETQQRIVDLWNQGLIPKAIATEVGCSPVSAKRYLEAAGIENIEEISRQRRGFLSAEQEAELVRRYQDGEKLDALAAAFGYKNHVGIIKRLQRTGVARRRRVYAERSLNPEEEALSTRLWREGLPIYQIAERVGCDHRVMARWLRRSGMRQRVWGSGIRLMNDGYVGQWVQEDHPFYCMADSNKVIRQHRLVMAQALGRPLSKSETVHHINGDRADNRLENLQLRQGNHGKGARFTCADCGSHNVRAMPL